MNCVTECMLRATSIGVGNVVVDMNTTSFKLMWTTNMAYNSSYFITLSANSENVVNISTYVPYVNLMLQINLSYSMDIYFEVNKQKYIIATLQLLPFRGNNYHTQGNIKGLENLTVVCMSVRNCSTSSIKFPTTPFLNKIIV